MDDMAGHDTGGPPSDYDATNENLTAITHSD